MTVQIQHRGIMQGFIAALKDGFGFIETVDHNKEVFFHYRYYYIFPCFVICVCIHINYMGLLINIL